MGGLSPHTSLPALLKMEGLFPFKYFFMIFHNFFMSSLQFNVIILHKKNVTPFFPFILVAIPSSKMKGFFFPGKKAGPGIGNRPPIERWKTPVIHAFQILFDVITFIVILLTVNTSNLLVKNN